MTKNNRLHHFIAAPIVVIGLGLPMLTSCSSNPLTGGCSDGAVVSFKGAANAFIALGAQMDTDVSTACIAIATAGGGDPSKWTGKTGDDLVTASCAEANAAISATLTGGITLTITVVGGECHADFSASATCNAQCSGAASCTPADLQAQCEGGKLSGTCSAECTGSCEATGGSVDCAGSCSGECDGTCSGTCDAMGAGGKCAGTCHGSCTGMCKASCEVVAAHATCMGQCSGSCTGTFTAPSCTGKLTPPKCNVDAQCSGNCNAQVQADAKCTPPSILIEVNGTANAKVTALVAALEVQLPILLENAVARGQAAVDDAGAIVKAGASLSASLALCAAGEIAGSVTAAASVSVSFKASASVSASAGAM